MTKINILIADDHAMVAAGVQAILKAHAHIMVLATLKNGIEVLQFLENQKVDIVLMDINMPEMNGIVCTKKVKDLYPNTKVIILTMFRRKQFMRELMDAGADGCILKSNSGKELLKAIERVVSGMTYFDHVHSFVDMEKEMEKYELSRREIEIIEQLAEGLTSKEIGERLFISEHTVKTHRKNIFRKVDVKSLDELIQFAMNEGLV